MTGPILTRTRAAAAAAVLATLLAAPAQGASGGTSPAPAPTAPGPATVPAQPSSGCRNGPQQGRFIISLQTRKETRTALVVVPPQDHPLPLVLVFHAAGSSAGAAEAQTGFTSLGRRDGFIVAYPNSGSHFWRLGNDIDVRFARAVLDQIDGRFCTDDTRVYATGVSNGASLVSRLGCTLSDRLTAIAPVAGDDGFYPGCQPTRPISVLEIHGSADGSVPYDGSARFGSGVWRFLGTWMDWDRCPPRTVTWSHVTHGVLYAGSPTCANGTVVGHIKLRGEPHAWPSLDDLRKAGMVGFSARQAVWRFLSAHATPTH